MHASKMALAGNFNPSLIKNYHGGGTALDDLNALELANENILGEGGCHTPSSKLWQTAAYLQGRDQVGMKRP